MQPLIAGSVETELVLIVHDFNVDACHTSPSTVPLWGRANQYITKTTHVDGATLGHVYWTGPSDCISTDVVACHWSEHNIVTVSISTSAGQHHHVSRPPDSRTTASAQQASHIATPNICTRPAATQLTPNIDIYNTTSVFHLITVKQLKYLLVSYVLLNYKFQIFLYFMANINLLFVFRTVCVSVCLLVSPFIFLFTLMLTVMRPDLEGRTTLRIVTVRMSVHFSACHVGAIEKRKTAPKCF